MKVLRAVLLLAVVASVGAWFLARRPAPAQSASGTIETDEVHVASRYGGRVTSLLAQEGDSLTNGQVIAILEATELAARRAQAAAFLEELERGPRTNEITAARHEWEALRAESAQARADAARAEQLFADKTIDAQARDQAVALARTLEERAQAAAARYQLLHEGTRPETVEQARAALAEIDAQLAEMTVRAPEDGNATAPPYTLEILPVKVGDVLAPNREVATLLLADRLWVRVYVPEPWLGLIRIGQEVKVQTDAPGRPAFTGVVEQINRQAEFTPRNVQTVEDRVRQVFGVKVRLPADTGQLRAGMSVDVVFPDVPAPPK